MAWTKSWCLERAKRALHDVAYIIGGPISSSPRVALMDVVLLVNHGLEVTSAVSSCLRSIIAASEADLLSDPLSFIVLS